MERGVAFRLCLVPLGLVGILASAFEGPPSSQKDSCGISILPDRTTGIYRPGDEIAFTVRLTLDGRPVSDSEVAYRIEFNGRQTVSSGTVRTAGGEAVVRTPAREPGSLMARAHCRLGPETGIWAEAGAFVLPESGKISPGLPAPGDFDAFWDEEKRKLAAVPLNAKLTPVPLPQEFSHLTGIECFDVQVDCIGPPVSGYLCRPRNAREKSLPAHITFHGAGVRSSSIASAISLANQGRIGLDINAHGLPNGRPPEFYQNLLSGDLRDYPFIGSENRETCYFLGMYLRVKRAIDFVTSLPEWNGILVASGASQGGAQAIVAGGLDPRVTIVSAGLPALCDLGAQVAGRPAGWPVGTRRLTEKQLETFRYFDVCNFAARCRAKVIVRVGLADRTCWPAGVMAMAGQLPAAVEILPVPASSHTWSPPWSYTRATERLNALIAEEMKKLNVR